MSDDATGRRYDRDEVSTVLRRAAEAGGKGAGDNGNASFHDASLPATRACRTTTRGR